ncbi:MAG TPA: cupin domain-containing protein [Chloroflexota bacterium]|nr:cupin domain-containing protein [Chloroflexota bacterium]
MPIPVYDFHTDLSNLVVEPEIRSRFRRVELGPVPEVHSHDLGGETFVVMEGQIEFTVADEHVVCQQGQAIFVPPRTTHAVRAVGAQTGVIYLSVSPHVEPTHTFYGPDGQRLPPRYGVWRAAGGSSPASDSPSAQLATYRAAAQQLAALAQASAATPVADVSPEAIKSTVDQLWAALKPVLEQVEVVERTWNALAQRASA